MSNYVETYSKAYHASKRPILDALEEWEGWLRKRKHNLAWEKFILDDMSTEIVALSKIDYYSRYANLPLEFWARYPETYEELLDKTIDRLLEHKNLLENHDAAQIINRNKVITGN